MRTCWLNLGGEERYVSTGRVFEVGEDVGDGEVGALVGRGGCREGGGYSVPGLSCAHLVGLRHAMAA